jgi:ethanolamine utilization protein EutN
MASPAKVLCVLITIGAPAAWWFAPALRRVVIDALSIDVLDEKSTPTLPK